MAIGLIIAGVFVLSMFITWGTGHGIGSQMDLPVTRQAAQPKADLPVELARERCPVCAQLSRRHARSSDAVVAEIERRAAADTDAIAQILRSPRQDAFDHIYLD